MNILVVYSVRIFVIGLNIEIAGNLIEYKVFIYKFIYNFATDSKDKVIHMKNNLYYWNDSLLGANRIDEKGEFY